LHKCLLTYIEDLNDIYAMAVEEEENKQFEEDKKTRAEDFEREKKSRISRKL